MQEIEVNTEDPKSARNATVKIQMADNVSELMEQFGADVVFSHAKRSIIIAMQTSLRGAIKASKTDDEIQSLANDWKPGLKKPAKSPLEKIKEELSRLSPEDRKRIAREIREREKAA